METSPENVAIAFSASICVDRGNQASEHSTMSKSPLPVQQNMLRRLPTARAATSHPRTSASAAQATVAIRQRCGASAHQPAIDARWRHPRGNSPLMLRRA